jgi:hypothetical protein
MLLLSPAKSIFSSFYNIITGIWHSGKWVVSKVTSLSGDCSKGVDLIAVMERQIYQETVTQTSFSASIKAKSEIVFSQTEAVSSDVNGEEAILMLASLAGNSSEPADGWPVSTRESNRQSFHYKIFE